MLLRILKKTFLLTIIMFLPCLPARAQGIAPLPPAVEIAPLQEAVPVQQQEEINPTPAPESIPMETDGYLKAPMPQDPASAPLSAPEPQPAPVPGTDIVLPFPTTPAEEPAMARYEDYPVIKLQSLDKITARTIVFEARVGSTVKFGPLYIKIPACRKTPPIEKPEAAAFLQIWEVNAQKQAKWVFSGWMFASSPALSSMNHPVYDVWVIDCLEHKTGEEPVAPKEATPPQADIPAKSEAPEPLPTEELLD